MGNWVVNKEKKPQVNSQVFILRINGEYLEPLAKPDYKERFEIRTAKAKVLRSAKLDPVDAINELLEEMVRVPQISLLHSKCT